MNFYNFKNISVVPNASEFCDVILSKTQRKTPTVIHKHNKITKIRSFYMRKIKITEQNFNERLSKIIQEFPKIDSIHPFYSSLLDIYYDKDHYKIGLGQLSLAKSLIHGIGKDYNRLIKFGDSLYRCKQLKKVALGKMVKIIKKQKNNLEYLEQVRQHISRLPCINPYTRTLIICGYPNVGKSSFLNKLTRADVDVQPYPFTTKSLYVGHMDYKYLRWQLIDTPGILDQKLEDRNVIEMQSITALAYLRSVILYFIDISEDCGYSIDDQIDLFNNVKTLFIGKPVVIICNKIDLLNKSQVDEKFQLVKDYFKKFNDFQYLFVLTASTVNNVGIKEIQEVACNSLLSYRVENKLRLNKYDSLNRPYVAYPKAIDESRKSFLPNHNKTDKTISRKRKLERDIELEMGDDYTLDLKKQYTIPHEYKYDNIPEIWEGHNIMDFIQTDLFDKLKSLEMEEKERENSGFYVAPKIELDDEMKTIKELAKKIRERKIINKLESRIKKQSTKPKLSRITMPSIKSRSLSRFKSEMEKLSVTVSDDIGQKSMIIKRHNRAKKIGKHGNKNIHNNENDSEKEQVKVVTKKNMVFQRKLKKLVPESDRFIGTKKPKHLFSGKRSIGKTNRR